MNLLFDYAIKLLYFGHCSDHGFKWAISSWLISLNYTLFDIMSVCSGAEWHRPWGSAIAVAVSRTADSMYSAVNVAHWEGAVKIM